MKRLDLSTSTGALTAALLGGAPPTREVAKAHATRKLEGRRRWRGLDVSVENGVGSTRRGVDADGRHWATTMQADYGYVKGTEGVDGDHIDVFLAPGSPEDTGDDVYIVHTVVPGTDTYDEDKVFLGFESAQAALACFSAHYDQPERHYGAITTMGSKEFVAWCQNKDRRGQALSARARSKVNLERRAARRVEKALWAHVEWMRGVLSAEGTLDLPDELPGEVREVEKALSELQDGLGQQELRRALPDLSELTEAQRAIVLDPANAGKRLLYVPGHVASVDLAHEITPLSVLAAAWPYYEANGNFDIEHATKATGKTLEDTVADLKRRGLAPKVQFGKVCYEVGRPVPGSFAPENGSYLVEIYGGDSEFAEAANWFWDSIDPAKTNPPVPWKTSIAGQSAYVDVIVNNRDARLGLDIKNMRAEKMTYFRWNNTAATLEAVNHWSPPVRAVSHAATRDTEKGVLPMSTHTVRDAILAAVRQSAEAAAFDLLATDQISPAQRLTILHDVEKALGGLEGETYLREVSKALDYGAVSTDAALLTGGGAATHQSMGPLSDFQKRKKTDELLRDTEKGLTPFQKGFVFSDDPVADVAGFVQDEYGVLDDDDCLDIAEGFFVAVVGRG